MTKQVQFRRGTTAQHSSFTGALAEITVDTNKKTAIVHDGTQVGGFPLVGSYGGTFTFTTDLDLIPAATKTLSLRGGNGATASLTFDASNNAQFFHDLTIGNADTDNLTLNSQFVTGTKLKTAKSVGNTLAISAYDVDGTSYTDLVTVTAGNTPTIAITSTGVGSINNINIGGTTRGTGAFTTLDANNTVGLSPANASVTVSPSGTGSVTINPATAGTINNMSIGATTRGSGAFTTLDANGNVTLGDASGDTVTVNGTTTFNAPVSFSGGTSHLTLTGELRGPATFILDPAAVGDDTGLVRIKGDLEVLGTTTTINSTVTSIADPIIELRRGNTITAADGGVQVNLTTNGSGVVQTFQRLQWNNSSTRWETTDGTTAKPIVNTVDAQTIAGNKTFSNNLTADGANAAINFSPTGSGTVNINPAAAGNINRMNIGATTRGTGAFTTLDANSTVGLSPANANVTISPTGTGSVTIAPATVGSIDRMNIGANVKGTGAFTSLAVKDTSANFDVAFVATSSTSLNANRNLTFDVVNANRSIKLAGNIDIANNFTTSGNFALTLTTSNTTNVTLPAGTVTLVDLSSSQALTNKTISGLTVTTTTGTLTIASGKTLTTNNSITFAGTDATTMTFPSASGNVVTEAASQNLTNKTCASPTASNSIANKGYVDALIAVFAF